MKLALFTDLYELTMAYGYWKREMAEDEAVFHLFFRTAPFQGGYTIACGLHRVIEAIEAWHFAQEDLDYLATLRSPTNDPLFEEDFLHYLATMRFTGTLFACKEGEVVFPYEPLLRFEGSILQGQLLESLFLNVINFQSLIATKAARTAQAAKEAPIIEFGMRRAQGIDGALSASRAAFIGGCSATSNTLAGKLFGIPVCGTHAHSWVMAFDDELTAFKAYAETLPHNAIFLVDTYDTLQGVKNAIEVGLWLKEQGRPLLGIRLDSGDIAYLSIESRKMLDEAGFHETKIFASNNLDEHLIADLNAQGAQVAVWGVGTSLVTGAKGGALDGVYKISAFRKRGKKEWSYRLKFAERMSKTSDPGILQVARFQDKKLGFVADAIYDEKSPLGKSCRIVDPLDPLRKRTLNGNYKRHELLTKIFDRGQLVYDRPPLEESRSFAKEQLALFDRTIKRFCNPHSYPVGMEESHFNRKLNLVQQLKGG